MAYNENLLTNPSAESALTGWTTSNVSVVVGGLGAAAHCFKMAGASSSMAQTVTPGTNANAIKIEVGCYTTDDLSNELVEIVLRAVVTQTTLYKKMFIPILAPVHQREVGYVDDLPVYWYKASVVLPIEIGEPVASIALTLSVAGLSADLYVDDFYVSMDESETGALKEGESYYGVTIGKINGLTIERLDGLSKVILNSDQMTFQALEGEVLVDKIYFDPITGKYVFDGDLSATTITALQTLITPNLYADKATIAELTVDRLETSDKVEKYLATDTSDVNYIKIYDQYIQFITASTTGSATEQVNSRMGEPLYWTDETHTKVTTDETELPVLIYTYTELTKMQLAFEEVDGVYIPKLDLGAGDQNGNSKGHIYKGTDGLYIEYVSSTGTSRIIKLTDEGIDLTEFEAIKFSEVVQITGMPQIWVQPKEEEPPAKLKDVWIKTNDWSRYDLLLVSAGTTLKEDDDEVVIASGSGTITLHVATSAGIIKRIHNVGTGLIVLAGTINGKTNMNLFPNESVELITDGSGWRCL